MLKQSLNVCCDHGDNSPTLRGSHIVHLSSGCVEGTCDPLIADQAFGYQREQLGAVHDS